MKLLEALKIAQQQSAAGAQPLKVALATGFEPLHVETFLCARLKSAFVERNVLIECGLYGDLLGNIERLASDSPELIAIVAEWPDFDPRLGLRGTGGWGPDNFQDILKNVRSVCAYLKSLMLGLQESRVALSLPTLPIPPLSFHGEWRGSAFELELASYMLSLARDLVSCPHVRLVNTQWLDRISPPGERWAVDSELRFGFPYTLNHADAVCAALCRLMQRTIPKKGLITDLDNTIWKGILGDDGPQGVSWDLANRSHMHAIYQQFVRSLSDAGTLVAIASKNEPALVQECFDTRTLHVPKECFFPLEINWHAKSHSVKRILKQWNIGADSVVFVDDSPLELAEVKLQFPEIECIQFPPTGQAVLELIRTLRNLFGKDHLSDEDRLRLNNLRHASQFEEQQESTDISRAPFLQAAGGRVTLLELHEWDARTFDLINKTNQFNLNGLRWTERQFRDHISSSRTFLLVVSYGDKYGPLGKIAAIAGSKDAATLRVDTWVMSCRAFSRQIEHLCLQQLFEIFDAPEILFEFQPTSRNGPLQDFFQSYLSSAPRADFAISRTLFESRRPTLFPIIEKAPRG